MKTSFFSTVLFLICFAGSLFSNNNYPSPADVVKTYFAGVDQGNIEAVGQLLSEDFMAYAPFSPQPLNKQAWKGVGQGFKAGFPDMQHLISEWIESGNKVAVRGRFTGKNDGPMMGNPPTGNRVDQTFNTYFVFDNNGKIKTIYLEFDQKAFEAQLMAGMPNPAVKAELDIRAFIDAVDRGDVDQALTYCTANSVHYFGEKETGGADLRRRNLDTKTGCPAIY